MVRLPGKPHGLRNVLGPRGVEVDAIHRQDIVDVVEDLHVLELGHHQDVVVCVLHVFGAGLEVTEVGAASGAEAALAPGHVAASVGELLRALAVHDVRAGYPHDAPVQESQDSRGFDIGNAGHGRKACHIGEATQVVQHVGRERSMLAVEGHEVEPGAAG